MDMNHVMFSGILLTVPSSASATVEETADTAAAAGSGAETAVADSSVANTYGAFNSTTFEESTPLNGGASPSGGSGNWVGWTGVGLAVAVGVLGCRALMVMHKHIETLKFQIRKLEEKLSKSQDDLDEMQQSIAAIRKQKQNGNSMPSSRFYEQSDESAPAKTIPSGYRASQEPAPATAPKSDRRGNLQVRYATLQSPDERGQLRFAERSMSKNPSADKMFLVEYDEGSDTGTYRINPDAKRMILGDLQVFKDFVKPFSFSGDPSSASIRDIKPGRIVKRSNFWIVEEKLEIGIK